MADKLMHIDEQAEERLIALAYAHPEDLFYECDWLTGQMFGLYKHQKMFDLMKGHYKTGGQIGLGDELSFELAEAMVANKLFEVVEDANAYFLNLISYYGYLLNDMDYIARKAFELYKKRLMLEANANIAKLTHNATSDDFYKVLVEAKRQIEQIEALSINTRKTFSLPADAILNTEWPEPAWVVEKMLPVGLSFVGGKPKGGKSWLMLQLAWAVGTGNHFLGYKTNKGRVLYMALEDSNRRLNSRMRIQGWQSGVDVRFMTLDQFNDRIGNLTKGGVGRLLEVMKADLYKLIIIDTQARAFGGANQFDPEEVVEVLSPIQQMAVEMDATVLFVDHMPKLTGQNKDIITDLYGSVAKVGVADTLMGLYRDRGQSGATLSVLGREVIEFDLSLNIDWDTGTWSAETPITDLSFTPGRFFVLEAINEILDASVAEIADMTDRNKGSISRDLKDLSYQGLILEQKTGRKILYQLTQKGREVYEHWEALHEKQLRLV